MLEWINRLVHFILDNRNSSAISNNSRRDEIIYQQDCEFHRYQDRLRWSRFQTISAIEGAILVALYKLDISLSPWEARGFIIFGTLLVLIISFFSVKDGVDAGNHLKRIKEFEEPQGKEFPKGPFPKNITFYLLIFGFLIITALNIILLVHFWDGVNR